MTWAELAAIFAATAAILSVVITCVLTVGKIGRMAGIMETTLSNQNVAIGDLKSEMKTLTQVVTQQAVQNNRIDAMSERLLLIDKRVDELAHGEGFVLPLPSHVKYGK
ncbi:MAG TPA: hypothetical protein VFA65_24395 [Bryobacteraceae bacterium]|nr:hypothetical protein [Bryobacteraceae bacterium]